MTDPAPPDLRRRLPVTGRAEMAAPPGAVWDAISAPGNLEAAHPYVRANPVERWPGVGSCDRIVYYSGLRMTRRFLTWHDGADGVLGYDLDIWHRPSSVSHVRWRVTPAGAGRSTLAITVWPYLLAGWPPVLRQLGQALGVRPFMAWYLRSVVRGFRHVVETGEPVRRNQFGPHPTFSPRAA